METPLTPMEFARRARRLYADREAVVDGDLRLSYAQLLGRCDRWSAAAAGGRRRTGRSRRLHCSQYPRAPRRLLRRAANRRRALAHQLPACAKRFRVHHQPLRRDSCLRTFGLSAAVDGIRSKLPGVKHFVALEGAGAGWTDYETTLASYAPDEMRPVDIAETDLITINYTSGTTARPKGVMITHRNAYLNSIGTLAIIT